MLKTTGLTGFLSAAALSFSALSAQAQGMQNMNLDYYIGGNVAWLSTGSEGLSDDADIPTIYGRFGAFFNPNFSGEVRVGLGLTDDSVDIGGVDADIEINYLFGAYFRGGLPVNEAFYPYAVIGYTWGEVDVSAGPLGGTESESDISYGIGADYELPQGFTVNAEYIVLMDKDEAEVDGFSIGVSKSIW